MRRIQDIRCSAGGIGTEWRVVRGIWYTLGIQKELHRCSSDGDHERILEHPLHDPSPTGVQNGVVHRLANVFLA